MHRVGKLRVETNIRICLRGRQNKGTKVNPRCGSQHFLQCLGPVTQNNFYSGTPLSIVHREGDDLFLEGGSYACAGCRNKRRVATKHPERMCTVDLLTTRYSDSFIICSLCVANETSVALSNSIRVVPPVAISHPHRAKNSYATIGIISLCVVSTCLCTFSPEDGNIQFPKKLCSLRNTTRQPKTRN
jgi:hypothetical protein